MKSNVVPRLQLVMLASLASCTERPPPSAANAPATPATVIVTSSPPAAGSDVAPSRADPNALDGAPATIAFLRDGTLAIATDKEIATIDAAGTMRRKPLSGRTAQLGDGFEAIALEGSSDLVLLETPSLRELFTGVASALSHPTGAIVTREQPPSVVMQIEGRAARFTLPAGKPKRVDGVDLTADRTLAVVTWAIEETMDADAAVFEVATGRLVGRALPMGVFASMRPVAAIAGDMQYGVEKRSVIVIDLKTGAVVRRAKPACPKEAFLGNPLVSPAGDFLLVTCGDDGIGLDPKTLVQRRRYSKIMPGCDNGDILPANYDPKKKTELVIEGCGGEARLDLTTGNYRCSDDVGLVGAPYDMGIGTPLPRRAPAGRESLPQCRQGDDHGTVRLGTSGTYSMTFGAPITVVHAGGKIDLDDGAGTLAISPDESKMAFVAGDRVIVRALPSGAVLKEIAAR